MKRLLPYLKKYTLECILGPLFKLLEALLELFVPLVIASIIDSGIPNGNRGFVLGRCLILVALGLVGLLFSFTAQYFAARASAQFAGNVRRSVFEHIQNFSYEQLDKAGSSALLTRLTSDMNQLQQGINLGLRLLLRSPFVVFGAAIMAFTIDVKAALIFVVAIPVLAVVVFSVMLGCVPLYKKVQTRLEGLLRITRENLTGVRVIRAFGHQQQEQQSFYDESAALNAAQWTVSLFSTLLNPATSILINLAIAWLVWQGAIRVDAGTLTQGQVVALYNYMSQILVELIKLASLIITLTKAAASASRVADVLDMPAGQEIIPRPLDAENDLAVCFENASFAYPGGGDSALKALSLDVKKGQTIGIIGGTGSGKTTLVNLIGRFYDATEGRVLVNGFDVKSYDPAELRKLIGIVPQKAQLFSGSIRSNLLWGNPDADDEQLWQALSSAQADEIVAAKENGLDSVVEQAGRNLSGGQKQRLTIARALLKKPQILILDDSSSALDFATDLRLRQSLKKLPWKPTVFIVSQRTSSISHADNIVVLSDGRVAGIGSHEQLLENCSEYREIDASQNKKEAAK